MCIRDRVRGWVRNNRNSNKFGFIELNDGTFFKSVQLVYEEEFIDNFEQIAKAYVATALAVTGIVTLTPNAKQPFEIKARKEMCIRDRYYGSHMRLFQKTSRQK